PNVVDRNAHWIAATAASLIANLVRLVGKLLVEGKRLATITKVIEQRVVITDPVRGLRLEPRHPPAAPDKFAAKILRPEDRVEYQLQIAARNRIIVAWSRREC